MGETLLVLRRKHCATESTKSCTGHPINPSEPGIMVLEMATATGDTRKTKFATSVWGRKWKGHMENTVAQVVPISHAVARRHKGSTSAARSCVSVCTTVNCQ